jgi:hypothetical protein
MDPRPDYSRLSKGELTEIKKNLTEEIVVLRMWLYDNPKANEREYTQKQLAITDRSNQLMEVHNAMKDASEIKLVDPAPDPGKVRTKPPMLDVFS